MKTKKTEPDPSEILVDFDAMQSKPIKTEETETIWDRDFRAISVVYAEYGLTHPGMPEIVDIVGRATKFADEMQKIRNERKEK